MARHCEHKEETVGIGRLLWANQMAVFTQCFLKHIISYYDVLGGGSPVDEGEIGWRFIYGYDAVCRRVFTLTNFFCTVYRSNSWHLAMASANIACISWGSTFLQTDIAICLVIVVCFRIFLSVFTVHTLKNRVRGQQISSVQEVGHHIDSRPGVWLAF